jgi:hypothetical protein
MRAQNAGCIQLCAPKLPTSGGNRGCLCRHIGHASKLPQRYGAHEVLRCNFAAQDFADLVVGEVRVEEPLVEVLDFAQRVDVLEQVGIDCLSRPQDRRRLLDGAVAPVMRALGNDVDASASRSGWCSGNSKTEKPRRMRRVAIASAVASTIGEPWTFSRSRPPSACTKCSLLSQRQSKPRRSASWASSVMGDGPSASSPPPRPDRPKFHFRRHGVGSSIPPVRISFT